MIDAIDEIIIAIVGSEISEGDKANKASLGSQVFLGCRKYIQFLPIESM